MLLEIGSTVGFVVSGRILAVTEDQVLVPSRYRVYLHHFFRLNLFKRSSDVKYGFFLVGFFWQDYAKTDGLEYICPQCSVTNFKKKMQKTTNGYS